MSAFHVGATIKITGNDRHPISDMLLLDNLDFSDAAIIDLGASDGSTSVDLIRKLPSFRSYTIADLFLYVTAVRTSRHVVFWGPDGKPSLVVGRRLIAWPSLSRPVRAIYAPVLRRVRMGAGVREEVLLLNPAARALVESDTRVKYRVHDVFQPWAGERPDVIKVANLLRRLYFSDAEIIAALGSLYASLDDGGHLLIVDNPRIEGIDERGGLYRRWKGRFMPVAHTEHRPEIDDLVSGFRAY